MADARGPATFQDASIIELPAVSKSPSFKDFVEDQLAGLRGLRFKAMFGGYGLYRDETFFAIVFRDRLYFKTDETTRADYEDRGMTCFRPSRKQALKNYLEVPAEILEDRDELIAWAERACDA
jgi:DNA transformation protein